MRRGSRGWPGLAGRGRLCYNFCMTIALKLIRVGNSTGVILPKEVLARLRVELGDELFLSETPEGVTLRAHDPDFAEAMTVAEGIMREDRDILHVLAQ